MKQEHETSIGMILPMTPRIPKTLTRAEIHDLRRTYFERRVCGGVDKRRAQRENAAIVEFIKWMFDDETYYQHPGDGEGDKK